MQRIEVIDSHTAGEPTRLVMAGGPDLVRVPYRNVSSAFDANSITFAPPS
jgi:proline racemase